MWSDANIVREWKTDNTESGVTSATGSRAGADVRPVTSRRSKRRESMDSIDQLLNEAEELEEKRKREQYAKRWRRVH